MGTYWTGGALQSGVEDQPILVWIAHAVGAFSFITAISPTLSLLPAVLAALIGEVAGLRSGLYYVVAGGLAAGLLPFLAGEAGGRPVDIPVAQFFAIFLSAGFAGGFVYWLIAGRNTRAE